MTDNKSSTSKKNNEAKSVAAEKKEASEKNTATDKPAAAESAKKTRRSRRRSHTGGFTGLLLFVLFVGVIAAMLYWVEKQQKELASHNRYQIDQLRTELSPALEQLQSRTQDFQQRLTKEETTQQELNQAFSNLLKTRRHLRNDWLLAEADYLLRLANHRLLLARDVGSALAAMQTADERLRDLADPAVIPVRTILAEDINQLKAVQAPDIAGLSARLSALASGVDGLPLLSEYVDSTPATPSKEKKSQVEDWRQLPDAIWDDMKKLLVIRERHGKVIPLLSPKQHFFLSQNLKLKLEQARLALLKAEPAIYQERLQTASDWIGNFFKPDDPATIAMLEQLTQLAKENIKPHLPNIAASYRALQDFREQQITGNNGDAS